MEPEKTKAAPEGTAFRSTDITVFKVTGELNGLNIKFSWFC